MLFFWMQDDQKHVDKKPPVEWYTFYSDKEGREYYYNPKTKVATWIFPDNATVQPLDEKSAMESNEPMLSNGRRGATMTPPPGTTPAPTTNGNAASHETSATATATATTTTTKPESVDNDLDLKLADILERDVIVPLKKFWHTLETADTASEFFLAEGSKHVWLKLLRVACLGMLFLALWSTTRKRTLKLQSPSIPSPLTTTTTSSSSSNYYHTYNREHLRETMYRPEEILRRVETSMQNYMGDRFSLELIQNATSTYSSSFSGEGRRAKKVKLSKAHVRGQEILRRVEDEWATRANSITEETMVVCEEEEKETGKKNPFDPVTLQLAKTWRFVQEEWRQNEPKLEPVALQLTKTWRYLLEEWQTNEDSW
jgi:hypothetical protein